MALSILTGPTILSGTALSDALDCSAGQVLRIIMPSAWTAAPMTFEVSSDNVFYNPLFNPQGQEVAINVRPTSEAALPLDFMQQINWLKVRSGTIDSPINQATNRAFKVVLKT